MAEEKKDEQPIVIKKIIKKGGHGGHHGGAWKVAYADFVTAMMALFLLLWLVNVDPSSKSAVSSYFRQPTQTGPMQGNVFIFGGAKRPANAGKFEGGASFLEFQKLVLTGQNKEEVKKLLKNEFQKELELETDDDLMENVDFKLTDKGVMVEIKDASDIGMFGEGSAALTGQAKKIIDKFSKLLSKNISPIVVAGYTDGKEYSLGNYDNWSLSTDRALAVKNRLIMGGISRSRFGRIEGYGSPQLKNPDNPADPANRRITLVLLQQGELEKLTPEVIDPEDKFERKEKKEMIFHSTKQSRRAGHDYFHKTGGKDHAPPSLEELRRKRERQSRPKPTAPPSGGGH